MSNKHIVILVSGTLFEAKQGRDMLEIFGVGRDTVAGIGALFGSRRNTLEVNAEIDGKDKWIPLTELAGRWILVIPEDTYTAFRDELSHLIGTAVIDGRVVPNPNERMPEYVSDKAIKQVKDILNTGTVIT